MRAVIVASLVLNIFLFLYLYSGSNIHERIYQAPRRAFFSAVGDIDLVENKNIGDLGVPSNTTTSAKDAAKDLTVSQNDGRFPDRLVYNRVPKCGSMTAVGIMKALSQRNNFTVIASPIFNQAELTSEEEQVRTICAPFLSSSNLKICCHCYCCSVDSQTFPALDYAIF